MRRTYQRARTIERAHQLPVICGELGKDLGILSVHICDFFQLRV
jgi:hypothetical protein